MEEQVKEPIKEPTKKLFRSQKDRLLAGVCGGLARYFEMDPVITRVIFIALTLFHGIGLIIYLILAVIVPNEYQEKLEKPAAVSPDSAGPVPAPASACCDSGRGCNGRQFLAAILIIAGCLLLMEQVLPGFYIRWDIIWPMALILFGLSLFFV